jgi:hypothetical protein
MVTLLKIINNNIDQELNIIHFRINFSNNLHFYGYEIMKSREIFVSNYQCM